MSVATEAERRYELLLLEVRCRTTPLLGFNWEGSIGTTTSARTPQRGTTRLIGRSTTGLRRDVEHQKTLLVDRGGRCVPRVLAGVRVLSPDE